VVLAASVTAGAAEPDGSKVVMTWDQFKSITGWDGKVAPGEILIPWAEAEKMLGVDVKGVEGAKLKLSWDQFRKLVEWSIAREQEDKVPPPSDYVISKATYVGRVGKDAEAASFEATFDVEVLRKQGWKRIHVLPATVGVSEITLPKDAYLNVRGNLYEVLTRATGKLDSALQLKFAAAVAEEGGLNSISFERVPSGTCLVDLTIERTDVDVTVAGAQAIRKEQQAGATRMLFALPAGNRIAITWERRIEEVKKGPPKLYAQTQTLAAVGDGIVTCTEKLTYSIVHAGVRELSLTVPDGVNVLDVSCSYLHDWRVNGNTLTVQLGREVKGVHEVELTCEQPFAEDAQQVETPVVRTTGTERERGFVAVVALANVEISGEPTDGASTVDHSSLPPELVGRTGKPVLLAYRYVGRTFGVPLQIVKHEDVRVLITVVDAATFTVMQTLDGRRINSVIYDVRNNRNQFLRVTMPEHTEIWSVSVAGKAAQPALDQDGKTLIPLVRSTGQQLTAFPVEIVYVEKGFAESDFKPPADGEGAIHVSLPRCDQPIMNVMCHLFLPRQGRYDNFRGPLTTVRNFRDLQARVTGGAELKVVQAEQRAQQIQKDVQQRLQREARPGVKPIEITLPTTGQEFKLQKVLVLEEDKLWVELDYTHWPGYTWSLW
jgi:hypothetical protein